MSDAEGGAGETVPKRLRAILAAAAAGDLPPNVAAMRLLIAAGSEADIEGAVAEALGGSSAEQSARLGEVAAMLRDNPGAGRVVRDVMAMADHAGAPGTLAEDHWAGVFDRLARQQPEAAVALYALGSPDLLEAATAEIVACLADWRLIGLACDVLDVGCGIGRFVRALAPRVRSIVGTDVSGEMIGQASRRCRDLANARLARTNGRDLGALADDSFDLVLAADVFPYLSGGGLASAHVREFARVLRPGGALLILNYSYRGDLEGDRRELDHLFAASGFAWERPGTRDLEFWDAACFLGRLQSAATPP